MSLEFVNLTCGMLKEILEDVPDEYIIRVEDCGLSYPVMNYEVLDNLQEVTLKVGDLNEER